MNVNFPKQEKEILDFWKKERIFEKSIEQRNKARDFVFYEGPPTANAKPGIHHVLARVFKDIICRYKTMRGFKVLRKAGWDTHGLPVELEIEKKLGFKSKQDIEKYGVAQFNEECKKSVWEYKEDWEKLTERIGFWLDMEHPYITYENDYIETLWWEIKKIWEKGLLRQDYKVVPYCPRCQTTLSAHEVAQGYKKIAESAIYIKLKIRNWKSRRGKGPLLNFISEIFSESQTKDSESQNSYLLVWTTTPWTLPANVAVALNPKLKYVEVQVGPESFVLAKERLSVFEAHTYKILREFRGEELIGLEYEPLYLTCNPGVYTSAFKVIKGDFVVSSEGTGLVHIAPAFGEDDLEAVKNQNRKIKDEQKQIPILMTVDEKGRFIEEVGKFAGMFVRDTDKLLIKDLEERGILYKEEKYEHDYPFCWRCDTALLYYAKKSWFIEMQKVKKALLKNNQKINWIPDHLKEGRFGEWLRDLKDWAISRERYWGTPLPIWYCPKCQNFEVIGSKKELFSRKFSKNRYFILRHGYSEMNKKDIIISTLPEKEECFLTSEGEEEIKTIAEFLKNEKIKIDLMFSSDLLRTTQTAGIISKELGIDTIYFDERLRDIQAGIFEGKTTKEYHSFWKTPKERFIKSPPEGESYNQVKMRIYQFLKEINKKYEGKTILIVSHQRTLDMLRGAVEGLTPDEFLEKIEPNKTKTGELREIEFRIFPYNNEGELDFHRPFVDEIEIYCQRCGSRMKKIPEVLDCWFDSGSMPFAQGNWPFASAFAEVSALDRQSRLRPTKSADEQNKKLRPPELFPADYISEAVDQTRGWFYTLLAVSTLLEFGTPYKNVISLGHVLDKKGEKMSKSKGNTVDPTNILEEYGADVLRWYFFTINQPGDSKRFDEAGLKDCLNKFILTLWNSYSFFETYISKKEIPNSKFQTPESKLLLNKWIISKLNTLTEKITARLDRYDIVLGARAIEEFTIDEFSNWYIRRSRRHFQKPKSETEKNEAVQTLGYVLLTLSKLCAPFIPFLSETIYRNLGLGSVHLEDWPKFEKKFINRKLEEQMDLVRRICALGLKLRAKAGIKVRQPLSKLKIKEQKPEADKELLNLIKEELNVKEVETTREISEEIKRQKNWLIETEGDITLALDTEITLKLKEESQIRELIRQIQDMRKKAALTPKDKIIVQYKTSAELENLIRNNKELIRNETFAEDLILPEGSALIEKESEIDGEKLWLGLSVK